MLDAVGIDKDSGNLWQDYIHFIKSGPGIVGQQDWQGQQKMDLLRKAYQRAVCIPTPVVDVLWKDYTNFEMGLNKVTVRHQLSFASVVFVNHDAWVGSEVHPGQVTRLSNREERFYSIAKDYKRSSANHVICASSSAWIRW